MVESGKVSDHEEALERAGRNNSLQIYEPVEKKSHSNCTISSTISIPP